MTTEIDEPDRSTLEWWRDLEDKFNLIGMPLGDGFRESLDMLQELHDIAEERNAEEINEDEYKERLKNLMLRMSETRE